MPTYVKSVSFYNRAALAGQFNSPSDDGVVNQTLDDLRERGGEIKAIETTSSGGFFKYVLTYVIIYEASKALD
ncbi:MAG: hypothetical protein H8E48_12005 [Chloroflexi bacterium]|nr:hypothetical protein [Chloroflexota bacterium]